MSCDHEGIFLIDKQVGVSSFWVVRRVRRLLGIKKVGHAGTLDPFASGLLVVCAGRQYTRLISQLMDGEKEYEADLCLGIRTSTLDPEGEVLSRTAVGKLSAEKVQSSLALFVGNQQQIPPAFSALKHHGKPLYHYARKGILIQKEARDIHISQLEWMDTKEDVVGDNPYVNIRVVCSKGTYIRVLADDIGNVLGCGAYLANLRRTRSGPFSVQRAIASADLTDEQGAERLISNRLTAEEIGICLQNRQ